MRPLEDITIVALEQYGAGPFGSVHLADLGAQVIKIEDPRNGGDVGRYVPPHQDGEDSLFFETFNRNKRSLSLDLGGAPGREVFEALVSRAHAVYSNVRGDVPGRLRIRYEDLKELNPRIVCCCISAFGMTGARQHQPGYDYIMQGLAGWMSLTGEPDGPPVRTGPSLVDYSAGYVGALATLSGIHAAARDGRGMDCDISLYDVAISLLGYVATWHLTAGTVSERKPRSAHPSMAPFQNFPTATGWIVVACAKEKFWSRLADVLDWPELAEDPRYSTFAERREHSATLLPELERRFRERPTAQWLADLEAAGIPCGKVNDVPDALGDPLVAERRMIVETEHPNLGHVRQVVGPVRVGPFEPVARRGPLLGEHNAEVLKDLLSLESVRIDEVLRSGAFGEPSTTEGAREEVRLSCSDSE